MKQHGSTGRRGELSLRARWMEMVASPAFVRAAPFAIYIAFLPLTQLLASVNTVDTRWLYPLQVGLVALALVRWRAHYDELGHGLSVRHLLEALGAGLLVFVIWIASARGWMMLGTPTGYDARDAAGMIDWRLAIARLLGAALVVPLMEELFWRSFLLRWLVSQDFRAIDVARVPFRFLVLHALLFGAEHHQWFAGVLAGMIYAWLYMRTRNLWTAILAHGVTNGTLGVWVLAGGAWEFW